MAFVSRTMVMMMIMMMTTENMILRGTMLHVNNNYMTDMMIMCIYSYISNNKLIITDNSKCNFLLFKRGERLCYYYLCYTTIYLPMSLSEDV